MNEGVQINGTFDCRAFEACTRVKLDIESVDFTVGGTEDWFIDCSYGNGSDSGYSCAGLWGDLVNSTVTIDCSGRNNCQGISLHLYEQSSLTFQALDGEYYVDSQKPKVCASMFD